MITEEERKVILHTFKNIHKKLEEIKGLVDSCARDIKFYAEREKQPKADFHKSDGGSWS